MTSCETERELLVAFRHEANAGTRAYDKLLVEVPIAHSHAGIDGEHTGSGEELVAVEGKHGDAVAAHIVL